MFFPGGVDFFAVVVVGGIKLQAKENGDLQTRTRRETCLLLTTAAAKK